MTHQQNQAQSPADTTATRNASLADLADLLKSQQADKVDVVAPAAALTAHDGQVVVRGVAPVLSANGVTLADGTYRPTQVADEGIADKLRIPLAYLRRMRAENLPLFDLNVSGWLEADPSRRFLLRTFRSTEEGTPGVLRALLSDSYRVIDNFDILTAALTGVRDSGHGVQITGCDLTDRRMLVRVESEHVRVHAPQLLKGYRSPFTGQTGDELPIVSAGFVISNSEVGSGAFTITPRIVVQICRNGMQMGHDALKAVHLGAKLEAGVIRWSADTESKTLDLISARARDAVATFMDRAYVEAKLREIEERAGAPVKDPAAAIEFVAKKLRYTDSVRESVLSHFIQGGQVTAGGVMQAITATAQTLGDADAAHELEGTALTAMALVPTA
ncbi:DUF932 domain-containing protein [Actinacidiphila glaucinigra]|uniref:DUF932 domain-containing protein n=1 Tax=Actinacidiphila glaucinigra TaxID=235986 RepID=UPI0033A25AD2